MGVDDELGRAADLSDRLPTLPTALHQPVLQSEAPSEPEEPHGLPACRPKRISRLIHALVVYGDLIAGVPNSKFDPILSRHTSLVFCIRLQI
jgi:hypothetical protein